jgi:integrase
MGPRSAINPARKWVVVGSRLTRSRRDRPIQHCAGNNSDRRARKDLKVWLEGVGLPHYSPHKFRHGHAVYVLKLAKDIAELKAVSQNLMQANISNTDGVYGLLSEMDVKSQIQRLGQMIENSGNKRVLIMLTRQLLQKLEAGDS